ncbi:MAG: hypothetical protein V1676_05555 [Candidatus Diapherotrites archaeon]
MRAMAPRVSKSKSEYTAQLRKAGFGSGARIGGLDALERTRVLLAGKRKFLECWKNPEAKQALISKLRKWASQYSLTGSPEVLNRVKFKIAKQSSPLGVNIAVISERPIWVWKSYGTSEAVFLPGVGVVGINLLFNCSAKKTIRHEEAHLTTSMVRGSIGSRERISGLMLSELISSISEGKN